MRPNIVCMGSPECAVPFLDLAHRKEANLIVFTRKDKVRCRGGKLSQTPVKKRALELGLPVYELSMKNDEAHRVIADFRPDLYLVVAYGQILPQRILSLPKIVPLNVHFSLLPKYRGPIPVQAAVQSGDDTTGTTVMVMDKELDTGDIIYQEPLSIAPEETAAKLFGRLIDLSVDLLDRNWDDLTAGRFTRTPQTGEASYTKLIRKEDLVVDWTRHALELHRMIRAFAFNPGVRARFRDKLLLVGSAQWRPDIAGAPGEIVAVEKKGFAVACGEGGLFLTEVQPECKCCMPAASFIAGYRPQVGEKLC